MRRPPLAARPFCRTFHATSTSCNRDSVPPLMSLRRSSLTLTRVSRGKIRKQTNCTRRRSLKHTHKRSTYAVKVLPCLCRSLIVLSVLGFSLDLYWLTRRYALWPPRGQPPEGALRLLWTRFTGFSELILIEQGSSGDYLLSITAKTIKISPVFIKSKMRQKMKICVV